MHSRRARFFNTTRGNVILNVIVFSLILTLTVGALWKMVGQKNNEQRKARQVQKKSSLLESILSFSTSELKVQLTKLQVCSLKPLTEPASNMYSTKAHRVIGKGLFQVDNKDASGNPTGTFFAPENDPEVWIDPEDPAFLGVYKIHISAQICPKEVVGRTKFLVADIDPITGFPLELGFKKPWDKPCPQKVENLKYDGFFDTRAFRADYAIYFDRPARIGQFLEEPVDDIADDTGERNKHDGKSASYLSGVGELKYTGSLADNSGNVTGYAQGCGIRTVNAIQDAMRSVLKLDPCANVALYVAQGELTQPKTKISCLNFAVPTNSCPSGASKASNFFSLSKNLVVIGDSGAGVGLASSKRGGLLCKDATYMPQGVTNTEDILEHYITNHQPSPSGLSDADRNRRRILVIVGDGLSAGANVEPPTASTYSTQFLPLRKANIFYTEAECAGTALIETDGLDQEVYKDASKVFAGNQIYAITSHTPVIAQAVQAAAFPNVVPIVDLPPLNATWVASVRQVETGDCIKIIGDSNGHPSYLTVNYPYFLTTPLKVTPIPTETMDQLSDAYTPYARFVKRLNDRINPQSVGGLKSFQNAFLFFPIPPTDLDEQSMIGSEYLSARPFVLEQTTVTSVYIDEIATSVIPFYKRLKTGDQGFSAGIKVFGVTDAPQK